MAQNSSESGENSTIDTKINLQTEEKALTTVSNALNTTLQPHPPSKQDPDASSNGISLSPKQNPPESQNGETERPVALMELSRPIKTEGEASPIGSSTTSVPGLTNSTDHNPGNTLSETLTPMSALVPQLGTLGSQLTPEVQASAYKKANILALSALAKKGGPNAKEMLAVQQKLQEFLTSLITLAGQKGPQLKVAIQMHVQHLVTGQISEEEFAKRIENDLNSQHQPSLLPFLKSSVPHLKTRLQLQQAIMKELLQRQLAEKQLPPSTNAQPSPSPAPSVSETQQPNTNTSLSTQLTQLESSTSSLSPSTSSSAPVQQTQVKPNNRVPTPTKNLESQVQNPAPKGGSSSEPIVIPSSSTSSQLPGQQSAMAALPANSSVTATNLMLGLPKNVLEQLAKLPPEQQKFIYMHQYRKMQLLKQSQQQQQQNGTANSTAPGRLPAVGLSLPSTSQANAQTIAERQQQLVKEQQVPLVMGGGRGATGVLAASASKPVSAAALRATQGTASAQSSKGMSRTSFANMKLVPGSSASSSSTGGPSPSKGKGKSKRKDVADANDEDDEVGMDLLDEVGVNLQEESAHFLPQTVGETSTRSVTDEVFCNLPPLKRKVAVIAKRHGISEIPEDYITLLSHATQERMRGVVEKLTMISQHRVHTLKDDDHYQLRSETRSQLRILESIDRICSKRKQERENELTLKAAKSRSKGTDPEKAAKIREEAKQIQQDEAARLRNEAANLTALAAIGSRRKRPSPDSVASASGGASSTATSSASNSTANSFTANLFAPLSTTRAPKRHITSRDLIFYMEQERETRKSTSLYKALLK